MAVVYKNRFMKIERKKFAIRGKRAWMYKMTKPDVVVVLPFIGKGDILIEEQFRYPVNETLYELPAGYIEKNERPIDAAKRELEEETGYKAIKLKFMGVSYSSPGAISNKNYTFLATGLRKGRQLLDRDEELKVKKIKFSTALNMIKSNKIRDGKTIIAILYHAKMG